MIGKILGLAVAALVWACGAVPANVKASVSGDTVTITWDPVAWASRYDVCRGMTGYFSSSGACSTLASCEGLLVPGCVYTEPASPAGQTTTYSYRVRADDGEWSEWSNAIDH